MDPLPEALERADVIAAVEGAVPDEPSSEGGVLVVGAGRLIDGRPVRLFALRQPDREPLRRAFERVRDEWALAGRQTGVTDVLARGDEPVPWIAVEQPHGRTFREVGPALQGPERWRVLTEIAEILYRVGTPHLACHPGRIRISRDDGLAVRLDWGIDRIRLLWAAGDGNGEGSDTSEDDVLETIRPYLAPELRRDPSAGDLRSDVYTLGMLAEYGRRGEVAPVDGPDGHIAEETAPDDPVKIWVSNRATNPDPDQRFDSPYAFKRAALFGPSARTDSPESRNEAETSPKTGHGETGGGRDQASGRGRRAGEETDERGTARGVGSPDGSAGVSGGSEALFGVISRRQALGVTAGTALAGSMALLAHWTRSEPSPEESAAGDETPSMTASFDLGTLSLQNTGEKPLETRRLLLTGEGFASVPGQRLSGYVDDEELSPGETVLIPADPAYELTVYYERDTAPLELVASDGPAADEREPTPGPLYVPDLEFLLDRRDDHVQIEYDGGAAVPANHVRFVGTGFGGAPSERWDERLGIDGDDEIAPGDFTRYRVTPDAVVRVEWSPPYLAASTTVAQHEGENRPYDQDRGGVSGPRYDARNTGVAPSAGGIEREPSAAWSTELGGEARGSLAVGSGRVFASTGRYLYALDATGGEMLWRRYIESGRAFEPVVEGETVYVGTSGFGRKSKLIAVNVADGTERWAFTTEAPGLRAPTASDGIVFTAGTDSTSDVYVVDPSDGSADVIDEVGGQVGYAAFDGRRLYLREVTGELTAVGPQKTEWSYPGDGLLSPTVVDDTVYGVSDGAGGTGEVFAIDARDGTEKWTVEMDGEARVPQAVGSGTVFTGTVDGVVSAVDARSGERRWSIETGLRIDRGVATDEEVVYVAGQSAVAALAREGGELQWSRRREGQIGTEPVVSGDCLYLGTGGSISAFRRTLPTDQL